MRTTMDLPDQLVRDVKRAFPAPTRKAAFVKAVEKGLRSAAYEGLAKMEGAFPNLKINLAKLRGRDRLKRWYDSR